MVTASVIVPARNAQATLARTLAALGGQELEGQYEVIVVDDGSTDATRAIAERAPAPVRVVAQPASGPALARNRGVAESRGSVLAFCDADVFPTARWLQAGVAALERADMVQGRVLPDPLARLGPFDRSLWITGQAGLWETANLFVRRELFDRAGGFEEWLGPRTGKALAEDTWFGYRAQRLGARASFSEQALAHHAVFERGWRSYVRERQRLWYFPAMVRKMPEMRSAFLYRRVFLNPRHARLDLGLGGSALALALRSPLPLLAAVPYLRAVRAHSRRSRPMGPPASLVAAADLAADLLGIGAMAGGSARYRSLVL
jgi:glycosyltransferase involved in cell wall biosynthesis